MKQSSSQTGAIGELQFAINCINRGINASMPILHDSRYDVVTEYNGIFYRVQVKSTRSKDLNSSNTIAWAMDTSYSAKEVDFLVFYIEDSNINIIVPFLFTGTTGGTTTVRITASVALSRLYIAILNGAFGPLFFFVPSSIPAHGSTSCKA